MLRPAVKHIQAFGHLVVHHSVGGMVACDDLNSDRTFFCNTGCTGFCPYFSRPPPDPEDIAWVFMFVNRFILEVCAEGFSHRFL